MQPIPLSERVRELDVLRGFALFGILAANMRGFSAPAQVYFIPDLMGLKPAGQAVQRLIDTLVSGKFITLFSFLFGLGFAVQMERAEARGERITGFYSRRLLVLLAIGLAHAFLLWWGDILVPYALVGFLLLVFRVRSQKSVFVWSVAGLWLPVVLMAAFVALAALGVQMPAPSKPAKELINESIRVYSQGAWVEIFRVRAKEIAFGYTGALFFFPKILGMFLLGLWVWRLRIVPNIAANLTMIRRAARWGWGLGLPLNVAGTLVFLIWRPDPVAPSVSGLVWNVLLTAGMPALSCAYACTLVLAMQRDVWRRRLEPLGAMGRTALSNYLFQSLVCTTLFYSYGGGFYGRWGPEILLIPTFALYAAQIPLSVWWTRRFRFGPMEWVWRSLTYGRLAPVSSPSYPPSDTR